MFPKQGTLERSTGRPTSNVRSISWVLPRQIGATSGKQGFPYNLCLSHGVTGLWVYKTRCGHHGRGLCTGQSETSYKLNIIGPNRQCTPWAQPPRSKITNCGLMRNDTFDFARTNYHFWRIRMLYLLVRMILVLPSLLTQLFYFRGIFWFIKNHRKFLDHLDSVWYYFSVKLKNKEKTETGTRL